jgi:TRAP-type C4-dicarboxylate transport system permease small subunit
MTYPDDGGVARFVRKADGWLGRGEQIALVGLLAAVVLTAAFQAVTSKLLHVTYPWEYDIIRGGTFATAMVGAAFATHQQRHLSMDLISRRLSPRGRLVLHALLSLFTIGVALLLVQSGMHQREIVGDEGGDHIISTRTMVTFMPLGGALIIFHTLLHMVIDLEYLVRGKLPPERARTGH